MKKDVVKRVKVQPVFEGTILSKARKIIDRRGVLPVYKGKPVIAIDADGEEYNFQSCAPRSSAQVVLNLLFMTTSLANERYRW